MRRLLALAVLVLAGCTDRSSEDAAGPPARGTAVSAAAAVRAGGREQQVLIGVGAACPGQVPPAGTG